MNSQTEKNFIEFFLTFSISLTIQEKYGFKEKIVLENNMLVVISDLHLSDGTATNNLSPRAFKHFFNFIKRSVRENTQEIIIVFAGDTFDLLRTEYWMTVHQNERPWGMEEGYENKKHMHIKIILEKILEANSESFETLKLADKFFSPIPIQWVIMLGNHDRMLDIFDDLKDILWDKIGNILLKKDGYVNEDYGVTIKHGHEYDEYNYEPQGVPIGDVNTTELFVKLPYEIKQEFPQLKDELKSIGDIRPSWRMFDYLLNTYREKDIKTHIEKAVDKVVNEFFHIPYVRYWIKHHDTSHPF
ncbi:MAG: metallophosphoesterase, partial [Syntrophorhabdaceae bacterium]|nr:metallophosphoesterase [Syntrophorhabdaceae bacterium]